MHCQVRPQEDRHNKEDLGAQWTIISKAHQTVPRYLPSYIDLYPPLESLTFILKKFIYLSGLSAPYKGGISSYALVLMIVAFIQN